MTIKEIISHLKNGNKILISCVYESIMFDKNQSEISIEDMIFLLDSVVDRDSNERGRLINIFIKYSIVVRDSYSVDEVSEAFGIPKNKISSIEGNAIRKIKNFLSKNSESRLELREYSRGVI